MSPCFSPFGHISIHSLRMEGDCPRLECVVVIYRISIHSLRMEGDIVFYRIFPSCQHFNPLPPHGGRRRFSMWMPNPHIISIHSLRMEGDRFLFAIILLTKYFNPLPPHGGRPHCTAGNRPCKSISIHSLRMEGDSPGACAFLPSISFQSTPSAWRETYRRTAEKCA